MDSQVECCSKIIYEMLCEIVGNEEMVEFNRFCCDLHDASAKNRHNSILNEKIFYHLLCYLSNFHIEFLEDGIINVFDLSTEDAVQEIIECFLDDLPILIVHFKLLKECLSGSRAEGFDFESSDYDIMHITKSWKVIDPTQEYHQQISDHYVLVKENVKPGYVRLRVLMDTELLCGMHMMDEILFTRKDKKIYLSCEKSKELYNLMIQWKFHGPCISTPNRTIDQVLALSSDTWPHEAVGCVQRLLKRGWPSQDVIREMVKDGCLFVPIGCKTSPYEDIEWRMSFSLAEKRLVHSMNHTQFLTYSLLKLFLNEVIKKEASVKNHLCSYFMKTLVLWEIVDTNIQWDPSCLLRHFWNCFRRLLSWISNENCPNFFVPENNMFYGKIYGRCRQRILQFLSGFHTCEDILLNISSFHEIDRWGSPNAQIINNASRRSVVINKLLNNIEFDFSLKAVLQILETSRLTIVSEFCHYLRLFWLNITFYRHVCGPFINTQCNRKKYVEDKAMLRLIKVSSPDCVQGKMFLAIYFYKCNQYAHCVRLLRKILKKIYDEETIYTWDFDVKKYASLGGDVLTVLNGMYKYSVSCIPLNSCTSVPEISSECNETYNIPEFQLVSPLVLTRLLFFLCHFRGGEIKQAHGHMTNLQYELLCDNGCYIPVTTKPLSWQILGICQEIIGDLQNAMISYTKCEECIPVSRHTYNLSLLDVNKERKTKLISLLSKSRTN